MPCNKKSTVCTKTVPGARKVTFGPQKTVTNTRRRIKLTKRILYGVNTTIECTGKESRALDSTGAVCVSLDKAE